MAVETTLLILESALLVATIILLLYSIREGKGRKNLLLEVGKATKILTRQEYFLTVTDSMMDARVEIIGFITGRPPELFQVHPVSTATRLAPPDPVEPHHTHASSTRRYPMR